MKTAKRARTVVIAEETPFVRNRFKAALETSGHRSITVETKQELLAQLRKKVHLILLNLKFGSGPEGSSALDLVREIRKKDKGTIPILVFSGTISSPNEVRELAALGVAGYVNEYSAVQHIIPALHPHLVAEESNRRKSPRVVLGMPISYRFGRTSCAALTLTLSRGGVSIATSKPLAQFDRVHLKFRLPGSQQDVEADAEVRWSSNSVGMGLQFENVTPADQELINQFVDAHFFKPRVAAPSS